MTARESALVEVKNHLTHRYSALPTVLESATTYYDLVVSLKGEIWSAIERYPELSQNLGSLTPLLDVQEQSATVKMENLKAARSQMDQKITNLENVGQTLSLYKSVTLDSLFTATGFTPSVASASIKRFENQLIEIKQKEAVLEAARIKTEIEKGKVRTDRRTRLSAAFKKMKEFTAITVFLGTLSGGLATPFVINHFAEKSFNQSATIAAQQVPAAVSAQVKYLVTQVKDLSQLSYELKQR